MNRGLYTILTLLLGHQAILSLDNYTNQTYMFVRPIFNAISIQQASWHNVVYKKQTKGFAFQATGIYQESYENLMNSSYFLFNFKNKISITGGSAGAFQAASNGGFPIVNNPTQGQIYTKTFDRDVLGQWLGITSNRPYYLELHPQNRQACIMLEASQDLSAFGGWGIFENWSLNISAPLTWIENNIGAVGDKEALNAFNQSGFQYCNIINGDRSNIALTQVTVSLGTKYMSQNDTEIATSTGVIVPLCEQPCNGSIFEPIQGFNSHFGFDTLVHFQFPIVKKESNSASRILMFFDLHNVFLSRNHQLRTYDIKNKPFSRYMQLIDRTTNQMIPAMNALTIRSRVEPFNIVNLATGFRFSHYDCFGEIGYELWAHGNERVTPEPDIKHTVGQWENDRYGIPFINENGVLATVNASTGAVTPLPIGQQALTASASTINYVAGPDGTFSCCPDAKFVQTNKYLSIQDLDRTTSAASSTITHKAFGSIGFGQSGKKRNYFSNIGAFIEATQNNAALCSWGGWLKAGFTF